MINIEITIIIDSTYQIEPNKDSLRSKQMYEVEGTVTLKLSRKELELITNCLDIAIPTIKSALFNDEIMFNKNNFGLYDKLLRDLNDVKEKWSEKEKEYYKKNRNKKA